MENESARIRVATVDDAEELRNIYAPYVEKTAISFEYAPPGAEEFRARMEHTLQKYPYLVAEEGGELLGYAYTGAFAARAAYGWAAETTVYLREDSRGRGLGKRLYTALEEISRAQNMLNLNACIACPEVEDERLTESSVRFHEHMGFYVVGKFHKCGYKFGTWYDMVWMEKLLGEHTASPAPVIPFPTLGME